jgi:hypothetical protein
MEAPKAYKDGGTAIMISGILNIMTGGVWFLSLFLVCVGFMWLIPMGIGAWQGWVGYQMMQGKPQPSGKMAAIAGIVAGMFNFNPLAIVGAVVGMMSADKPESIAFLETAD